MSPFWSAGSRRPTARTAELLVEELGDELLVYDQRSDQVHCLSLAAGKVWRACDGKTSLEQLGSALNIDSELVDRALDELDACGLLDGEAPGGVTRREATARLVRTGAAAAAAPLIYSIAAPTPALAVTQNFCANHAANNGCAGVGTGTPSTACANCSSVSCACCYTSPMMCPASTAPGTSGNGYARCTASCSGANNVCTTPFVANAGGVCAQAANCSGNFNACA